MSILFPGKIILEHGTVSHSKICVLFIRHLIEIRLHDSGDSIMCYQNIRFFIRFCPKLVQQILDPLRQLQHGLTALIPAAEISFRPFEIFPIPGRGFPFAEILLLQARFHPCRDSGHL